MLEGMNTKLDLKDWSDRDLYLIVAKSQKGYSMSFPSHTKLSKKRVIVHKALEQTLSGKNCIILKVKEIFERDKIYMLTKAEEVEPAEMDIVDAISEGKAIAKEMNIFCMILLNFRMTVISMRYTQLQKKINGITVSFGERNPAR